MFTTLLEAQVIYTEKKEREKGKVRPGVGLMLGGATVGGAAMGAQQAVKHRVWEKKHDWKTQGLQPKAEQLSFREKLFGKKNRPPDTSSKSGPLKRMGLFPSADTTKRTYDMHKRSAERSGLPKPKKLDYVKSYLKGKSQGLYGGPAAAAEANAKIGKGAVYGAAAGLGLGAAVGFARHRRNKELRKKYAE